MEKKMQDRIIKISFEQDGECLWVYVEDNGSNLSDERISQLQQQLASQEEGAETTELLNIHRRLQLQYDETSGIFVTRSTLGGLRVALIFGFGRRG